MKSRDVWILFLISLTVRLVFSLGTDEKINKVPDCERYMQLSDRVLESNFDFEVPEFIVSPIYPIYLAMIKLVSGRYWLSVMEISQSVLSAFETLILYGIADLLWGKRRVSFLAGLGHAFYPPNLMYVPSIGQEPLFEFFWVLCIYLLIVSGRDGKNWSVALSAFFFGLGYLTKSHILLFAPFVCVHYLINGHSIADSVKKITLFGTISFLMSVPWGFHNWRTKGAYILSSSGYGSHFLGAYNDDYYRFLFDPPPVGSDEYVRLTIWYELNVFQEILTLRRETGMSDKDFQKICYRRGLRWIRENRGKYYRIKMLDIFNVFRPGPSRSYRPFQIWLASIIVCGPIYAMAYTGILQNLSVDIRLHFWILGIILMMLAYVISFYFQGRFRTITIDPFLLIYSAFMTDSILAGLGKWLAPGNR